MHKKELSTCCRDAAIESFRENPADHHDPIPTYTCLNCNRECDLATYDVVTVTVTIHGVHKNSTKDNILEADYKLKASTGQQWKETNQLGRPLEIDVVLEKPLK